MKRREGGQVLAVVLIVLMIMMTLVPLMVFFVMKESAWTGKQAQNTRAFHMAEAGIEKGYLELSLSTQTWVTLMLGGASAPITHYKFDQEFTDVSGGTYKISITSGPGNQQATVIAVGRDDLKKEWRGIKAVYANAVMSDNAIFGVAGVDIGGKVMVEWGSIMSPNTITPIYNSDTTKTWPQLWSAGQIVSLDTDPNPPNCDSPNCCWWHAYQTGIPPAPIIDLNYYASQAKKAKASTYNCPSGALAADCTSGVANDCCYYSNTLNTANNLTVTGGATVYVNAAMSPGNGNYFLGSLLVMGNVVTGNGNFGGGSATLTMPPNAWKQYCEPTYAWPHYTGSFDNAGGAVFPGLNSSYQSPSSCTPTACSSAKLFTNGLLYVSGYMSGPTGGGGADFYGVMYVLGTTTDTANSQSSTFYYNQSAAQGLQLTQVMLVRQSWQDLVVRAFP